MTLHKIEPIDFLNEIVNSSLGSINAGEIWISRDLVGTPKNFKMSVRMAQELARESHAYRQFYKAAHALADLVDRRDNGIYVEPILITNAKDVYVTWRDRCKRMQDKPSTNIIKENGNG